jgi:hypothetical protein
METAIVCALRAKREGLKGRWLCIRLRQTAAGHKYGHPLDALAPNENSVCVGSSQNGGNLRYFPQAQYWKPCILLTFPQLPQLLYETSVQPNTSRLQGSAFLRQAGPNGRGRIDLERPLLTPFNDKSRNKFWRRLRLWRLVLANANFHRLRKK